MSFSGKYKSSVVANYAERGLMSFSGKYKSSVVANYAERGGNYKSNVVANYAERGLASERGFKRLGGWGLKYIQYFSYQIKFV
jgi:hypothetical protein